MREPRQSPAPVATRTRWPTRMIDRWTPRSVFVADALGAALTAITHGLVLVRVDGLLGIGSGLLRLLAGAALLIGCTSLMIVGAQPARWWYFLRLVAMFNGAWVLMAWTLLLRTAHAPTPLAWIYMCGESLLIGVIVLLEWRYARVHRQRPFRRRP